MPTPRTEGDLPDSCYGYVPAGEPKSARKIRLCSLETGEPDAGIVGAAAAALGPGYRGQKVDLPSGAVAGAKARVRAAWKRLHPDADDDEMPSGIRASEAGAFHDDPFAPTQPRLPKADARVNYREGSEDERCYGCRFYGYGSCALVEGSVEAEDVCDLYLGRVKTAPAAMFAVRHDGEHPGLTVFSPIPAELAEPPEWAPFLPTPGRYAHPVYGDLDFSPERYERIVANFRNGVYQERIPVNAEHDGQASGALGWITDLRLTDEGAVDARVEWTQRGADLIRDDRFRYVSAELYDHWSDPVTGTPIPDVAVGLALTTHPYFKESVLRPLAASEAVLTRVAAGADRPGAPARPAEVAMSDRDPGGAQDAAPPPENPAATTTTTAERPPDPVVRQLTEAAAQEFAELRRDKQRLEEENKRLAEDRTRLLAESRVKRFTAEVRGISDANGKPYVGHIPDHVRMLCDLEEAFGAGSWHVQHYQGLNRAHAEQMEQSTLFREMGVGRGAEATTTAEDQIAALAREVAARSPGTTYAKAFAEVLESNPELRAAHARERRQGRS